MRSDRSCNPVILVTGCNGQVGFELRRSLAPLGHIVALGHADCDLSSPDTLRRVVRTIRPDVIVNPAAYTAVDHAEENPVLAQAVNGIAPGILAEEAKALDGLLVHYSTDYVFDGKKASAYLEVDTPNPMSVYGRSKLVGEQAVEGSGASALVLRTSWVAGAHGGNFTKTILRLAQERDRLRVIADQFGAPTTAALIADVTAQIVARFWLYGGRDRFQPGIYHLAASGETTWHGYALEVVRYAASHGVLLKANEDQIEAIPAADYPLPAPRPANSRLNTSKLRDAFGIWLPEWQDGIHLLLDQLLS